MHLSGIMSELLAAIIIACLPVLTKHIISYLNEATETAKEKTENDTIRRYLDEIKEAVEKAVECTSQTYVDQLKKAGEFTVENQKEAFEKALTAAKNSIGPEIASFIEVTYGDLTDYLKTRIEAEVRAQKKNQ